MPPPEFTDANVDGVTKFLNRLAVEGDFASLWLKTKQTPQNPPKVHKAILGADLLVVHGFDHKRIVAQACHIGEITLGLLPIFPITGHAKILQATG
jgi:hypothetical protein